MPHTPEQRSQHALCGARRKNGQHCRLFAGQGTDHPGTGRCKLHLGATATHKSHAIAVAAKQRMIKLGAPIEDIKPHRALLGLLQATTGHVSWLHHEIGALDDLSSPEAQVLVRLYDDERDRATRIAEACLRAGVDEREVRFTQAAAEQIVAVIRAGIEAVGGLSDEQRRKFFEVAMLEIQMRSEAAGDDDIAGPFRRGVLA
jgi:hypothetical protein